MLDGERQKLSLPERAAPRSGASLALPEREEKILKFWGENKVFEKSLAKNKKGKTFVFYEGPPTANGRPGIHHAAARAFKDIILRYKTMRGFYVPRRAGWDTHGLPVEIEVEKELGFKTKQDIEKFGIGKFNQKAKESVWKYKDEWERATKRLGFWLDFENPYITHETSYIEKLWWVIKEIWKKGLLYKDFKSLPWCPRCQTGLSSHELGLGYKKVKDDTVFVKLKIKGRANEYLLIWTTTPWTLPANVALAVNPKIEYSKFKVGKDFIWSAKTPPSDKNEQISLIEKVSGNKLLGLEYEPLFRVPEEYSIGEKAPYKIFAADFVSTEEGTGMVHIASAFGEEDLNLMKSQFPISNFQTNHNSKISNSQNTISYPILQTVNPDGTMRRGIIGEGKFVKAADKDIISDLEKRGLLLKVLPYEHDYPFCWRCQTPLLYFAKESWWIKMSSLRGKLSSNNEKVNWIPEHIKHGRFGEFLKEARDWAFSRERYWGTPLPVWQCKKCLHTDVVGSLDELHEKSRGARNKYLIMRHGEAENNIKNVISSGWPESKKFHLTVGGRVSVEKTARALKKENIDFIVSSGFTRTKETAEIVASILGVKIIFDQRLHEIRGLDGYPNSEVKKYISSVRDRINKKVPGGETLADLRKRILPAVLGLENKYKGKKILIVSHEHPLWILYAASGGLTNKGALLLRPDSKKEDFIGYAEAKQMQFKNLPRDESGAVNLHRPYVDDFELVCKKCGGGMKRISEVADVWFDSGSMPFASQLVEVQLPRGSRTSRGRLLYPADYIVEGVDQTRGWFYTLMAVGTLLGRGAPYKNVISLGHVLDKNGQKMSKSKGNVVDPWEMTRKYGSDAIRWYFYSINSPGEPKKFDEKDLSGKLRGFLMTLWNCYRLFDTYVDKTPNSKIQIPKKSKIQNPKLKNVLDWWILAKLEILEAVVTQKLDIYDITGASREIEEFVINDFSQWYLRRSRRRFQRPESQKENDEAARITAHALLTLTKLLAPFAPFLSEEIYQGLRKKLKLKEESVHLLEWPETKPKAKSQKPKVLDEMEEVRKIVTSALKLRAEAGIKVRQPLAKLQIPNSKFQINSKIQTPNLNELMSLIKDEVNVKEITFGEELKLDIAITPELKEEGIVREVVRSIQEMRKDLGLKPQNKIRVQFSTSSDLAKSDFQREVGLRMDLDAVLTKWKTVIMRDAGVKQFVIGGKKIFKAERDLDFEGMMLWTGIDKVN